MGVMFGMVKWLERVTADQPAPKDVAEEPEKDVI